MMKPILNLNGTSAEALTEGMEMDIGNGTERFIVEPRGNGRYAVRDKLNGRYVRYGYNNPPLYARSERSVTEWDNYYSARCFCQKLAARNDPLA